MPILPPQSTSGKYLAIYNSVGELNVLEIPDGRCVLVFDGQDVRFVDGTDRHPFLLPDMEEQEGGDVPHIVAMTAAGQQIRFTRDEVIEGPLVLSMVGGVISWLKREKIELPEGVGVLYRNADGEISFIGAVGTDGVYVIKDGVVQSVPFGPQGSYYQMGPNGPFFGPGAGGVSSGGGGSGVEQIAGFNASATTYSLRAPVFTVKNSGNDEIKLGNVNTLADLAIIGIGGVDAALVNDSWYHAYIVSQAGGTGASAILSLNINAPDLSSDPTYTYWGYAGVCRVTGSGVLRPFYQKGRDFWAEETVWGTNLSMGNSFAVIPGTVNLNTLVPPNVRKCGGNAGGSAAETIARKWEIAANTNGLNRHIMGSNINPHGAVSGFFQDVDRFDDIVIMDGGAPSLTWKSNDGAVTGKRRITIDRYTI